MIKITWGFILTVVLGVLLLGASSPVWAQSSPPGPGETVTEIINKGLGILRDPSLQTPDKMLDRRQQLWDLLEPIFDFDEIGRRALGQYWRTINKTDQQRFLTAFTKMMKRMYLHKSDLYKEGDVQYTGEILHGKRAKVQTNFVKANGEKIEVDLSMYNANGDGWKVYDVQVAGVSVLGNYRSQFDSILTKSSFEDLMKKIEEKINEPEK